MGKLINLTGQKFGRLTVIERAPNDNRGNSQWLCRCECGRETVVVSYSLKSGNTQSCGCFGRESRSCYRKSCTTHGMKQTRLYKIWKGMKARCLNPNATGYERYGASGIVICDEWRNSFEAFRDWAIASGYRDDLTLDRKDNNKGYVPENCKWSTKTEQANNRRTNRNITYNGKNQTITQWAREVGMEQQTLWLRLKKGWSVEKALTTPIRRAEK